MLDLDRVWARASQSPQMRGKSIGQFVYQAITLNVTLAANQALANQTVNFPAGAIIAGVCAAAQPSGVAATQTYRPGLDLFSVAIDDQTSGRAVVGTAQGIGSSVFGHFGDMFPAKELVVQQSGTLIYSVTNLTSSALTISFTHHCLVPAAQG